MEKSAEYNTKRVSFEIDKLFFDETQKKRLVQQITNAISNGKHLILIGPPGTGKSKLAKIICEAYCGVGNYSMCTATSDWSTFDTIGGYRPNMSGNLEFSPGVFLQCFQDKEFKRINKWFILDELNRADIDKAFGSLFSALTGDTTTIPFERSGRAIQIVGSCNERFVATNADFVIPNSWRIIATMNTFDKSSLYEMSYAFMRRFAFIPIEVPTKITEDLIREYVKVWKLTEDNEVISQLAQIWTIINNKRKIGPAIAEDIYKHLISTKSSNAPGYTDAIIMYVFPQFEGLVEDQQIKFVKDILGLKFIDQPEFLKQFASDFFGIDIGKFNTA